MDFGNLSNLSALGALITLVVWFVTIGLPRMVRSAEERETRSREEFRTMAEDSQDTFRDSLKDLLDDSKAQRTSCTEDNAKLRQTFGAELSAQRQSLYELLSKQR